MASGDILSWICSDTVGPSNSVIYKPTFTPLNLLEILKAFYVKNAIGRRADKN
jgi:hypothetical protein